MKLFSCGCFVLTGGRYPHLIVEFTGIRRIDPGSRVRVEPGRAKLPHGTHIRAVGIQHVRRGVRRSSVHTSSGWGEIQKAAGAAAAAAVDP